MKRVWLVLLTVSIVFGASAQDTMMKTDKPAGDATMMKSDQPAPADGSMMKSDTANKATMMVSDADKKMAADPMDSTAYNVKGFGKQVMAFTSEAAAQRLAKTQTVVYYFAATWCPDCQATYQDFKTHFSQVPKTLTILYVNYDKAASLKTKYGITSQHSFVVIGPMGEKKKAWSGAATVADIIQNATSM